MKKNSIFGPRYPRSSHIGGSETIQDQEKSKPGYQSLFCVVPSASGPFPQDTEVEAAGLPNDASRANQTLANLSKLLDPDGNPWVEQNSRSDTISWCRGNVMKVNILTMIGHNGIHQWQSRNASQSSDEDENFENITA